MNAAKAPAELPVTLEAIRAAADALKGRVLRTPSIRSEVLSGLSGADVVLKLENLQHTGSFKPRGALVKLLSLEEATLARGVIAASAGNHAQGVAYHARALGAPATIVMPVGTPFTKIQRTEALGARTVLFGEGLAESRDHAMELAEAEDLTFIHPFDDAAIIAGQGTIGLEMLEDDPDLDAIIVPIGGGGLIGGIAIAAKAIKPEIEIFGAEAALYPAMHDALAGHTTGALKTGKQTVAEGIAVKAPGELNIAIARQLVDDVFVADESELENAVQLYLETQRIVSEGAGAASLAVLLANKAHFAGKRVGLVVSGGNMDPRVLASVLMRSLVREGRLVRLRINITDTPGVLAKVSGLIGEQGANIVEVYHQRLFYDLPIKEADMDVVVETLDMAHVERLIGALNDAGFPTRLMGSRSDDTAV